MIWINYLQRLNESNKSNKSFHWTWLWVAKNNARKKSTWKINLLKIDVIQFVFFQEKVCFAWIHSLVTSSSEIEKRKEMSWIYSWKKKKFFFWKTRKLIFTIGNKQTILNETLAIIRRVLFIKFYINKEHTHTKHFSIHSQTRHIFNLIHSKTCRRHALCWFNNDSSACYGLNKFTAKYSTC